MTLGIACDVIISELTLDAIALPPNSVGAEAG